MKESLDFNTYLDIKNRLEIKMGTIVEAERVPKSQKMLKLSVDFGDGDVRTVASAIGTTFDPEGLINFQFPFITNLEPAKIMGVISQAMIVLPEKDGVIYTFPYSEEYHIPNGAEVF